MDDVGSFSELIKLIRCFRLCFFSTSLFGRFEIYALQTCYFWILDFDRI